MARRSGSVLAILDTKWRIRERVRVTIGDLGQRFIDTELFDCPQAVPVYPAEGGFESATAARWCF